LVITKTNLNVYFEEMPIDEEILNQVKELNPHVDISQVEVKDRDFYYDIPQIYYSYHIKIIVKDNSIIYEKSERFVSFSVDRRQDLNKIIKITHFNVGAMIT
jgi:hypothetical protein